MALTGNEVFQVLGQDGAGRPAATTQQVTTAQVAALASSESTFVTTNITTVGNGTLPAAALVGTQIVRTGPVAAYSDATATAAAIVAALPGGAAGSTTVAIKNATAFTQTITAGTGVTLPLTVIIPPFSEGVYTIVPTSSTAVTVYHRMTQPLSVGGNISSPQYAALSTVGAGTITAAAIANGAVSRTGATAAFTDTTDTADNIIAACANLVGKIGASTTFVYQNATVAVATLNGGTGVTVSGITVVPSGTSATYLVTYTAADTITLVGTALAYTDNIAVGPVPVGSALAVTPGMSGAPILLNTAAGSTATLPAATGSGNKYRFVVTTTATSNAHKILAASVSDFIIGNATGHVAAGTTLTFSAAAATAHSIQMPFAGTQPSGGFIGDWFEFFDVGANLWAVAGQYQSGTTSTTPFSAATT